jgi:glycosyltransferase involved in cell wall biosynthesis
MLLSIIIPCYNEENTIGKVISKIIDKKNLNKEIIVIDDGSTDKTIRILENDYANKIILIKNDKNYGKGYSLRRGINKSLGDIILIQDSDLEYSPDDYEKLIKPIVEENADVVFGTRFRGQGTRRVL